VAPLDLEEAVELYDLREVLDGLAARLAASRHDAGALTRLERGLGRMATSIEREDPTHWFRSHVRFHEEIMRAAGNRHLLRLSAVVHLSIRQFPPMLLQTPRRLADANREHRQIFEAIAARDPETAERAARAHIAAAREIVLKLAAGSRVRGGYGGTVQA
jgi:DNA-binding GntR family transcriptional regulator